MPRHLTALMLCACVAADWPQGGRDNTRNPVSPEKGAPTRWVLCKSPAGVKWQARIGDRATTPTIAGGLVWVGTNNQFPRDPKIKGDRAVLMCFRERDGQFLWQYTSARLPGEHRDFYYGCLPSPLAEGDRLYFATNRVEVVCLDVAPLKAGTGEPRTLWVRDLVKVAGVHPYGPRILCMRGSPPYSLGASYKGRLYVATSNGTDLKGVVPAPKAPSLVCLDAETGKILWADASPGAGIMVASWSSPVVAEVNGRAQVIHAQGDGWLRSFNPLTGELLWKFDLNPKGATPYKYGGAGEKNFPTAPPVLYDGRVYIACGQDVDDGKGVGHLWCVDATKTPTAKDRDVSPGTKDSALVWCHGGPRPKPHPEGQEYVFGRTISSVAVHDGLVIAPERDGWVHCLDAKTGKVHWVADVEAITTSSPLIADGKVYVGTEGGDMYVFALSTTERLLAKNHVWSIANSPVFANGVMYVAGSTSLYAIVGDPRPMGHWPQWRGPGRLNVSPDKDLLTEWPKDGPPLAWRVDGIGEGVAGVAVAGGRAYVMGHRGALEHLTCVNEATGQPLWSVPLGPAAKELLTMRYLSQRTPLIDGDFVYAVTATGHLVCVRADTGKRVWSKDYARDLGGRRGGFGWCDQLLKDGDKLICVPGGKTAVVALNAATGEPVWKCPIEQTAAYVGAVLVEGKGVRKHYVAVTSGGLHGVSIDGKLLWESSRFARNTANSCTPNVLGRHLFTAANYGKGVGLYELTDTADGVEAKEVHAAAMSTPSWHEMVVIQGEHAYVGLNAGLRCLEWKTGKVIWDEPRKADHRPPYSGTCADGRLYVRTQQGDVLLVRASPEKFVVDGTFRLPDAKPLPGSVAPVVTGGRLFLRHEQTLFCYDVQKGAKVGKPAVRTAPEPAKEMGPPLKMEGKREPDTIFAPTPQPVVEAMLEAAKVKKTDVVVDLGCGDGRIVVTAARKYGCKALGYDLDPECVRMAKESVAKHKVSELVTIEQKDLFTAALDRVDVVALYLPPKMTERLVPRLEKLPAGARVVAHAFAIPGLVPEREFKVTTADGLEHKVFVYATPLRKAR